MEEEFRAILLGSSGVTALVADRVDWIASVQGTGKPYIVLHLVSGAEGYTITGPDGLNQARVQVDCYAQTYGQAKGLARAVIEALSGYRSGGFQGVFHQSSRDGREGGTNEAERPFRASLDFIVHHNRSSTL